MKFEESSLTNYLVKNLQPLTEADPLILADYVAALLKKDKPIKELQKLCAENLVEFLGQGTTSFITNLFHALEDGSVKSTAKSLGSMDQVETSPSLGAVDGMKPNKFSLMTEDLSPSGRTSDSEEKEISDDEDDDRNHKHRRRETHSPSSEKDVQVQPFRRQNRKNNRPFDNRNLFLGNDPQSSGSQYNPVPLGSGLSSKFERRHPGFSPLPQTHFESTQRTRINQAFRGEGSNQLDLFTPLGRLPTGRGRGRAGFWSQNGSRFPNVGTLDFASQMAPQGQPPNIFAGRGLQNAASTHNASWAGFGLVPGMSNGGLEAMHPLLQGPLRPPVNPLLSIGIPRQRCRDFEERGFCLRGDMCPMEHGVNRIVVEDVQSLSQFNLPVSVSSTHLLGKSTGPGSLSTVSGPSSLSTNNRGVHGKSSIHGMNEDELDMKGILGGSASAGETDIYDPDQPLWNNNCPEASTSPRPSSPKIDDAEPLWNTDEMGTNSSVWGRIGNSGNKLEVLGKNDTGVVSVGYVGNVEEAQAEGLPDGFGNVQKRKRTISEDMGPKTKISIATSGTQNDSRRTSQKAQYTLFVNGIPAQSNKKEALLSHFKKFGKVIDIYIPLNSERAFVQFSTREEAQSALNSPDAVMGNRFIKLWWANRDSIPSNGIKNGTGNLPSLAPKNSAIPDPGTSIPEAVNVRHLVTNVPKEPPSQKKLDNLELLKEEIRLKQQMLEQKRNDFRRQLDMLEKKAVSWKGEASAAQVVKKQKVEKVTDVATSVTPKSISPAKSTANPVIDKKQDKSIPVENLSSPNSNTKSTASRSLMPSGYQLASVGAPFLMNRFKLDNRPTIFQILPPLPSDLANVAVLKNHFSSFGDLSTVELEDADTTTGTSSSEPSENHSARIAFTTRRSAERAFLNGKCCQGHNLQFSWLTTSNNTINNSCREKISVIKGLPDAEDPSKSVSASSTERSLSSASEAAVATGNGESVSPEEIKDGIKPMDLVEAPELISVTKASCLNQSSESDNSIHEDGQNVEFAG